MTFHWYVGDDPPFVGVAVNVTDVPAHIAPGGFAVIETLTGSSGLTVTVIAFEVAGVPVGQTAFEVSMQVMISPFKGEKAYVGLFVPALMPLTFH